MKGNTGIFGISRFSKRQKLANFCGRVIIKRWYKSKTAFMYSVVRQLEKTADE